MSITHQHRLDYEKKGFALMRSGSYVVTDLKITTVQKWCFADFQKKKYSLDVSVVVTNENSKANTRGILARFAYLSEDKKIGRYYNPNDDSQEPLYIPLDFIKAKVYTPADFLKKVKSKGQPMHIQKLQSKKEWCGMLLGSPKHLYSSLVVQASTPLGFDLIDFEHKRYRNGASDHVVAKQIKRPAGMFAVF